MLGRNPPSFVGTIPINFFYGLQEALRLMEEEGLTNVYARHARLGEAVRRCVQVWAGNNGPQLFCTNPARYSDLGDGCRRCAGRPRRRMRDAAPRHAESDLTSRWLGGGWAS